MNRLQKKAHSLGPFDKVTIALWTPTAFKGQVYKTAYAEDY
jgi:hypothetical protein